MKDEWTALSLSNPFCWRFQNRNEFLQISCCRSTSCCCSCCYGCSCPGCSCSCCCWPGSCHSCWLLLVFEGRGSTRQGILRPIFSGFVIAERNIELLRGWQMLKSRLVTDTKKRTELLTKLTFSSCRWGNIFTVNTCLSFCIHFLSQNHICIS